MKELKLKAIKAITSKDNLASINVLTKAGFKLTDDIDEEILFLIRRRSIE
jgi:RimJ/RimL family protein N-acetyltransferase